MEASNQKEFNPEQCGIFQKVLRANIWLNFITDMRFSQTDQFPFWTEHYEFYDILIFIGCAFCFLGFSFLGLCFLGLCFLD